MLENHKPTWHRHYYVLAGINVLVVLAFFIFNFLIVERYQASVDTNTEWSKRAQAYSHLTLLAGKVNAPGNNVFSSHNPTHEKQNLEEAVRRYQNYSKELKKTSPSKTRRQHKQFDILLTNVDLPMQEMIAESRYIFSNYELGQYKRAGEHMAFMDAAYTKVLEACEALEDGARDFQAEDLQTELNHIHFLKSLEYIFGIIVLALILVVVWYGKKMSDGLYSMYHLSKSIQNALDASAIVAITDPAGVITYANTQFVEISKYSHDEIIGKTHRIINSGYHPPEFFAAIWETILQGKVWTGEICNRSKDGQRYWMATTIYPVLDKAGKVQEFIAIRNNITQRKQLEAELEEKRHLAEQANQAKSEFLANMSHEIRTPMNGILGMAQILEDTAINDEQQDCIETIKASGHHLLDLINDILDFSKIEAGKLQLETIPFDLRVLVDEIVATFKTRNPESSVVFQAHLANNVPRFLIGDPIRIRQVLINFISNAFKFTKQGSVTLDITCEQKTDENVKLRFSVSDTGIGIPDDKLHHIFEKFTQVDTSVTREFGGTGLGLAISQSIVNLMEGEIGVESSLGSGSTFWFSMTIHQCITEMFEPMPNQNFDGLRVLAVDDDVINQKVFQHQLKLLGIDNTITDHPESVISILRQGIKEGRPYQIAILDYRMPLIDGVTLARMIKADADVCQTELMMITSSPDMSSMAHFDEAGFRAYLTKPVMQNDFVDTLNILWHRLTKEEKGSAPRLLTQKYLREIRAAEEEVFVPLSLSTEFEVVTLKPKVLLVEDNVVNQTVAVRLLEKIGALVEVAGNGIEAIEKVAHNSYDLVLMDCQMPEMDGYEATRQIRQSTGKNRLVRIVALTANALKGDEEKCLSAGMNGYLPKPFTKMDLERVLYSQSRSENSAP